MVWLHGYGADPQAYGLDQYAGDRGFAVAYPKTTSGCWTATAEEAAVVAAITREVQAIHGLDPARTYVAGHSAGAALAQVLGATHPDLYAAAGFVSDANTALSARGRVPAYSVWDAKDRITPYLTGRLQLLQWLKTPTQPSISVQPGKGTCRHSCRSATGDHAPTWTSQPAWAWATSPTSPGLRCSPRSRPSSCHTASAGADPD